MQFIHTWEAVLAGKKTQTHRLTQPEDVGVQAADGSFAEVRRGGRVHYAVGREYAVQPGRRARQVGRIKLWRIERQHVQDITLQQAIEEGVWSEERSAQGDYRAAFAAMWNQIHSKAGTRWEDNPAVWVLHFELVQKQ